MLNYIEDFFQLVTSALNGKYGWAAETIAITLLVIVCNCFVKWILKKLHFHFKKQNSFWKDSFVKALYKPLSYYIWFFAFIHALNLVFIRFQNHISLSNINMALSIAGILSIAWFIMRWKKYVTTVMIAKSKAHELMLDPSKIDAIDKVLTVSIAFLTILVVLEITGRSINTLLAFGGVGGLAIAFASQEIIANFFGGFMVYLTQPFGVGDWINVPERNIEGTVEEIGWNTTRIRTWDKRPVYIPNSIFSKLILMNPSRMSHRQIKEIFGLCYEDLDKMKDILKAIKTMLEQHPDIDQNQAILVRFSTFGQYSLDILLSAYTKTIDNDGYTKIKEGILFTVLEIIKDNGANFAFPTHHVLVRPEEALKGFASL